MMGEDRRFRDPSPEEISALTLEGMREAVMAQLHAGNIEVRGCMNVCTCVRGGSGALQSGGDALGSRRHAPGVAQLHMLNTLRVGVPVCVRVGWGMGAWVGGVFACV